LWSQSWSYKIFISSSIEPNADVAVAFKACFEKTLLEMEKID